MGGRVDRNMALCARLEASSPRRSRFTVIRWAPMIVLRSTAHWLIESEQFQAEDIYFRLPSR